MVFTDGLQEKVTGILLAGGSSKRMGREKGLIRLGDRYLFQYPLGVLETVCDPVLISRCSGTLPETSHSVVCDEVKGIGPMGGIQACLRRSVTDYNLVLSYDLPMVNTGLLEFLLSHRQGYDLVLPAVHPERPEPLCGIYHRRMAGIFEEMILEKQYALHAALPKARGRILQVGRSHPFFHPDLFLNINREEDLYRIPPDRINGAREE